MLTKLSRIAKFVARRPSNVTIRSVRAIYGLTIIGLLAWYWEDFGIFVPFIGLLSADWQLPIKSLFFLFGIAPVVRAILPWCLLRRKAATRLQMGAGIGLGALAILFIGALPVAPQGETSTATPTVGTAAKSYDELAAEATRTSDTKNTGNSAHSSPTGWLVLLGIFWAIAGISGKTITSDCLKYAERITTIRV